MTDSSYRAYIDLDDKRVKVSIRRNCRVGEALKKGCYYGYAISSKDPQIYGKNKVSRKYVKTVDNKPPPMVYGIDTDIGDNIKKVTKSKPSGVTVINDLEVGGKKGRKPLTRSAKDKRNALARERYRIKQKPKREAKCREWLK